ncbi:uncharacterized protein LOC124616439 [Schistocerca americana]|uniref:uncharacterized protein LOC124616439 n=1 Tax=Schistocerca americana TaxID=7009 RepID=UPI001F502788|nr:uncharacterized protein LOC124616439 [Schistocerca americana]
MNRHVALLLCASLAFVAATEEKYAATFDSLDLKEVLSDETRVQDAMRCLLEEGDAACRPAAKALKKVLPEIVRTDCAKCTETQHKKIGGFFGEISRRHPDLMKKLLEKYDPSGEYRKNGAEVSGDRPPLPPPATTERYAATPGHARPAYKPRQPSLRHSRQQVAHSADTTSMNRHVALLLCASLAFVAATEEKYAATFDSLDLKEVLSDETRVQDAMRCLLEEGDAACRPAAKALKKVLPEIVRTDCAKCTETEQKKIGSLRRDFAPPPRPHEEVAGQVRPIRRIQEEVLPKIVRTDCAKCTETQHKKIGGFFGEISRRHPDLMKKLLEKYDPSGEYRKKYAKSWAEHGIRL